MALVVGQKGLQGAGPGAEPQRRLQFQPVKFPSHEGSRKRDHLHGEKRFLPGAFHELRVVCHDDELLAHGGEELLPGQGSPTPLDEGQVVGDLIRPVEHQWERGYLREGKEREPYLPNQGLALTGRRHDGGFPNGI